MDQRHRGIALPMRHWLCVTINWLRPRILRGKTMQDIKEKMEQAAHDAAHKFITQHMGGEDRGACGFAWVTLWPEHKGNTKLGKAERRGFEALGARKDWTGKAWMIWNPSGYPVQNIDTLEAGARAAADVLKAHGYKATAGSRLD